jgi:hypothetical protein
MPPSRGKSKLCCPSLLVVVLALRSAHALLAIDRLSHAETQCILGIDRGDATCIFSQPLSSGGLDDYRITLYAVDYSEYLHGNTSSPYESSVGGGMPPEAWAMRCTPYGTTHSATWGAIIGAASAGDASAGESLLGSLFELPEYPMLGEGARGQLCAARTSHAHLLAHALRHHPPPARHVSTLT